MVFPRFGPGRRHVKAAGLKMHGFSPMTWELAEIQRNGFTKIEKDGYFKEHITSSMLHCVCVLAPCSSLRWRGTYPRPTPKGGRYSVTLIQWPMPICFNPRPPRKVGATCWLGKDGQFHEVSILAHPERWALPCGAPRNPPVLRVSILAHPERWALRQRWR